MKSESPAADALIVGGGFSGTMIAAELARRGMTSVIVEDSGREGRGTAYSTPEEAHLLNEVAGRMGAWADKPEDFAEAVAAEGHGPDAYVPRLRYGEYLSKILNEALATRLVTVVAGNALSAAGNWDGWTVGLADGSRVSARALVLAQGNQAPKSPSVARGLPGELFVTDPWSQQGRDAIARAAAGGGDVLIIGTGLTMVDVVLSLDEARHRGRIVALSRRGLVPRAHQEHDARPVSLEEIPQGSVSGLCRWLRRRGKEAGWRAAINSLRPHGHAIWQSLSEAEQRRFLRHARPWWDVHRHRIAPEVAGRIGRLAETGRLEVVAGRVTDMSALPDVASTGAAAPKDDRNGVGVSMRRRGSREAVDHRFTLAVNCSGPLGAISDSKDALLNGLFETGLAQPDRLDLGLDVDQRSRLVNSYLAWALGPLTRGAFWEIIAVPDIRGQVAAVADDIAKELKP